MVQNKMELKDDRHCFICGEKNIHGLKLKFDFAGSTMKTRFKPDKKYQGYADIVHGGFIGMILDEMMVNLPWKLGKQVVSAEYTIRLKSPAHVNEELEFTSRIIEDKGRLILVEGDAKKLDGTVIALATSKCMKV